MTGLTGYFLAGGVAGAISRTATAPFDRVKVYLIAQTGTPAAREAVETAIKGEAVQAAKKLSGPIRHSIIELWKAGGARSFFAGEKATIPNMRGRGNH